MAATSASSSSSCENISNKDVLSRIPLIKNGTVELFVHSVFKRKRWFDKYIRISSCSEPIIVIYELDYNQSYYELSEEDIEYLCL